MAAWLVHWVACATQWSHAQLHVWPPHSCKHSCKLDDLQDLRFVIFSRGVPFTLMAHRGNPAALTQRPLCWVAAPVIPGSLWPAILSTMRLKSPLHKRGAFLFVCAPLGVGHYSHLPSRGLASPLQHAPHRTTPYHLGPKKCEFNTALMGAALRPGTNAFGSCCASCPAWCSASTLAALPQASLCLAPLLRPALAPLRTPPLRAQPSPCRPRNEPPLVPNSLRCVCLTCGVRAKGQAHIHE
jgi:hypothetical protein